MIKIDVLQLILPGFSSMPRWWHSWGRASSAAVRQLWRQHRSRIEVLGNLLLFRLTSSTLSHHAMAEIGKCTVPRHRRHCAATHWHYCTVSSSSRNRRPYESECGGGYMATRWCTVWRDITHWDVQQTLLQIEHLNHCSNQIFPCYEARPDIF